MSEPCELYNADEITVGSATVETVVNFGFTMKKIAFLKNVGPSDVVVSFRDGTNASGKKIFLSAGDSVNDEDLSGYGVMKARLSTAGTASTVRYMVMG